MLYNILTVLMAVSLLPIKDSNYSNLDASENPDTTCLAQHRPTQPRLKLWSTSDIMVRYKTSAQTPLLPTPPRT